MSNEEKSYQFLPVEPGQGKPEAQQPAKSSPYFVIGVAVVGTLFLMLLVGLGAILLGNSGPQAVAQAYVDAKVEGDHETANGYLGGIVNYGRPDKDFGELESAVILDSQIQENDHAEVVVVWHYANADLGQTFGLTFMDSQWRITDLGNQIEGELDGETFIAFEPVSQLPIDNPPDQPEESSEEPSSAEPAPIITATPKPTATPSAFTLQVQFEESGQIPGEINVTVVELNQTQTLSAWSRFARYNNLPLGSYTVRVSAQGLEDNDYQVEARGDQPLPGTLFVQPGTPLPLDPNNVLLLSNNRNQHKLVSITNEGMITHWNRELSIDGWSDDFSTLKFHNHIGIGRIDITGFTRMDWTIPEEQQRSGLVVYRPDLQEIAYIQNKDLFTLGTEEGAEPVRWSQIGIYARILGWFDNDTLLVGTDSRQAQLLRRDGTNYQFLEGSISNDALIFDREGWLRFVYAQEHPNIFFYQPGPNEAEQRVQMQASRYFYGWSGDNNYFFIHSELDEAGAASGLLAITQDGQLRQMTPQLLSPRRHFVAWDLAPSGSQMVLSWTASEQAGLYIADAENQSMQLISNIVPNNVFWPTPDALFYVVEEGDNIGTWRQPLDGSQAQQLFAYRAEKVTITPDGRLLLVANNTLWEYNGTGAPRALGEEGTILIGKNDNFVWP